MATIVRQYRGTTAQHANYVGPEGSVTVDIDKDVIVVHDGVTAGGHPMAADKNVVHTVGDETVNGTKTFSSSPQVPSVDAFDVSTNAASTKQVDDALQTMVVRVDKLPTDAAALAALKAKLRNNAIVWALEESSFAKAYIYDDPTDSLDEVKLSGESADGPSITLNNTVTSTSTTEAATANAVKTAYDAAVTAQNKANAANTAAGQAQSTANAANTAAGQAQSTANEAKSGLANKLDTTGTAAAATKLNTARTIDGVDFNGTAAITHYGTCSTEAATAEKVVALAGFKLVTGARVVVRFTVTNTAASPTLNVNSTGAKAIQYRNAAITAGHLAANRVYEFVYDGSAYELIGDVDTNTTYTAASAAPKAHGSAAVGSSAKYAREDHVHPAQTTVSGNAGTATTLATARTVDGVSFNGSANITHYGTCSTAAATAAKTVALAGFTLGLGAEVTVRFTVTNTAANPTLNVNSTGAKGIRYRNAAISAGHLAQNRTYRFVYDGTYWQLVGDVDSNSEYSGNGPVPVGGVIAFAANSAPAGYILCNGAAVSRTTYAALFAKISTLYGTGDGSTTFNLPNLTDRFIQGHGTAGTVKAAGLPDITGVVGDIGVDGTISGAFYVHSSGGKIYNGGTSADRNAGFQASRSNSIYGASTTVQPPALTMRYYIKY